jgi:hypothetical protein
MKTIKNRLMKVKRKPEGANGNKKSVYPFNFQERR